MKLSSAFLLVAPVAAFAPGATVNRPASSLKMSTTETKVRHRRLTEPCEGDRMGYIPHPCNPVGFRQAPRYYQTGCRNRKGSD